MTKNSVCHAPYLRNHTPYDCHLQYLQYTSVKRQKLVQNPVFFLGEGRDGGHTSVSTSIAKKKIVVQLGSLEALQNLTSGVHRQSFRISWLFCILNSSKNRSHGSTTINGDKSLHQKSTIFDSLGSKFAIPNQYTSYKIVLDKTMSYDLHLQYTYVKG